MLQPGIQCAFMLAYNIIQSENSILKAAVEDDDEWRYGNTVPGETDYIFDRIYK